MPQQAGGVPRPTLRLGSAFLGVSYTRQQFVTTDFVSPILLLSIIKFLQCLKVLSRTITYGKEAFGQSQKQRKQHLRKHTMAPLTKALFLISGNPRVNSKRQREALNHFPPGPQRRTVKSPAGQQPRHPQGHGERVCVRADPDQTFAVLLAAKTGCCVRTKSRELF